MTLRSVGHATWELCQPSSFTDGSKLDQPWVQSVPVIHTTERMSCCIGTGDGASHCAFRKDGRWKRLPFPCSVTEHLLNQSHLWSTGGLHLETPYQKRSGTPRRSRDSPPHGSPHVQRPCRCPGSTAPLTEIHQSGKGTAPYST